MKSYVFKVVIEPDEDKWHARVPELEGKGATTWGETREARGALSGSRGDAGRLGPTKRRR